MRLKEIRIIRNKINSNHNNDREIVYSISDIAESEIDFDVVENYEIKPTNK